MEIFTYLGLAVVIIFVIFMISVVANVMYDNYKTKEQDATTKN